MSSSARKFSPAGAVMQFLACRDGSMMPMMVLMTIPLVTAIGFSVDYTSAVTTRSDMQNALDAAIIAITTLPTTTSLSDRQTALQQAYVANSGQGAATLTGVNVDTSGTATFTATASYPMPTNFMQIARINTVQVGVGASVRKRPALVQTTFKVTLASGYWNKTMSLYGTRFGQTAANKLMTITYNYNGAGDPKGYGTTVVKTVNGSTETAVQQQLCTTSSVRNFNNLPTGAITQTDGNGQKYVTTCANTMYPASSAGAVIDVSQMDQLYLQMDVPAAATARPPQPTVLKSNDAATSNRLYADKVEIPNGQVVDIFTLVPCGQTSTQAWEDGGSAVPTPTAVGDSQADFFYTVQGKCAYNQRPSETVLTQ